MMKYIRLFCLTVLLCPIWLLSACSTAFMQFEQYKGQPLTIGVIGTPPQVRERQIDFVPMTFSDLENQKFDSRYDAIFITRENLSKAAEAKYAKIYQSSKIPFFFIDSRANYLAFIDESVTYEEDVEREYNHYYVTGYLRTGDGHRYWKYAPYNGVKNEKTIEEVFSGVFKTIEEVKSQQMDGNVPAEK